MNSIEENTKNKKPTRVLALDAARGLAVIGMYIQHFALNDTNANIVSGNTMILFILCSGISFSIMAENSHKKGESSKQFSAKVLARSVFIDLLGYLIIMLNGPFAVILPAYAGLFILALGIRRLSDKRLMIFSGLLYVVTPLIMIVGVSWFSNAAMLADLAGGPLSAIGLLSVFTTGMVIGRQDLKNTQRATLYVIAGVILLIVTKAMAAYVLPAIREPFEAWLSSQPAYANAAEINEYAIWPRNCSPVFWHMLLVATPQSGTTIQLLMGMGASLLVLGILIWVEKRYRLILKPFSHVGQVALTLYALQFILAWIFETTEIPYGLGEVLFGDILVAILTTLVGCILAYLPVGFIEGLMRRVEKIFS